MPYCPECEDFIETLELHYENRGYTTYYYDYSRGTLSKENGPVGESKSTYWQCPHCHEKLFEYQKDAKDFLDVPELEKKFEEIENK